MYCRILFSLLNALFTKRVTGITEPAPYCANNSILLNINLGNGNTVVKPLRTINVFKLRNNGMSGALAYVRSRALYIASSAISIIERAPSGFTLEASDIMSRILPWFILSIRSVFQSRLTKRSMSAKNIPLRNINSCHLFGVFKKLDTSSPRATVKSTALPALLLAPPRPIFFCRSAI